MRGDVVDREPDELGVALVELGLGLGKGAQLGGADGGEVFGMGEEDSPAVPEVLVEVDGPLGCICGEVGGDVAQTNCHVMVLLCCERVINGSRSPAQRRRLPRYCRPGRSSLPGATGPEGWGPKGDLSSGPGGLEESPRAHPRRWIPLVTPDGPTGPTPD